MLANVGRISQPPAILDAEVAALAPAQLLQRLLERHELGTAGGGTAREYADPPDPLALLRPRLERPRNRTAEQRHDLAPFPLTEMHPIPHGSGALRKHIVLHRISQRVWNAQGSHRTRPAVWGELAVRLVRSSARRTFAGRIRAARRRWRNALPRPPTSAGLGFSSPLRDRQRRAGQCALGGFRLKRILRPNRLRLRGPCGTQDEFTLAAIAQNLRWLAKSVLRPPLAVGLCTS